MRKEPGSSKPSGPKKTSIIAETQNAEVAQNLLREAPVLTRFLLLRSSSRTSTWSGSTRWAPRCRSGWRTRSSCRTPRTVDSSSTSTGRCSTSSTRCGPRPKLVWAETQVFAFLETVSQVVLLLKGRNPDIHKVQSPQTTEIPGSMPFAGNAQSQVVPSQTLKSAQESLTSH